MNKLIACTLALGIMLCTTVVYGAETTTVNIPITYNVNQTVDTTFTLKAKNKAPMPQGSEKDTKKKSLSESGKVDFGDIAFTTPDLYEYSITKETKDLSGMNKDTSTYTVHIIVKDPGKDYSMIIRKEGTKERPEVIEYTDYITTNPAGKTCGDNPAVKKKIKGNGDPEDTFTFRIRAVSGLGKEGTPMPKGATDETLDVKAKAGDRTEFGEITFASKGEYVYEVTERKSDLKYDFDETVYTVTYNVSDTGNGLTVKRSVSEGKKETRKTDFDFTNTVKSPAGEETQQTDQAKKDSGPQNIVNNLSKTVKTGGISLLLILVLAMAISAGATIGVIYLKNREKEEEDD